MIPGHSEKANEQHEMRSRGVGGDHIHGGYQGKGVWDFSQGQREANEQRIQGYLHFKAITVGLGRGGALIMATSSLLFLSSIDRVCFPSPQV